MKWTTVSNGHTLTVTMDTEALIKDLDAKIAEFQNEIKEIEAGAEQETIEEYAYSRQRVYGNCEDDYVEPSECITDLEDMKDCIQKLAADGDGSTVWPTIALKKNGTFKKTCKPIIREECFGPYWEDSYGWNVEVLRIEPISDTEAEIVLTHIVQHY